MTGWPIAIALAAVIAAAGAGYLRGQAAGEAQAEARHAAASAALQAQLFRAADAMSRQAAEIETWRAAQAALIEDLEHDAQADPSSCRLSDAARLRLKTRWAAE